MNEYIELFVSGDSRGKFTTKTSLDYKLTSSEKESLWKRGIPSTVLKRFLVEIIKYKYLHNESSLRFIEDISIDIISNGEYCVAVDIYL